MRLLILGRIFHDASGEAAFASRLSLTKEIQAAARLTVKAEVAKRSKAKQEEQCSGTRDRCQTTGGRLGSSKLFHKQSRREIARLPEVIRRSRRDKLQVPRYRQRTVHYQSVIRLGGGRYSATSMPKVLPLVAQIYQRYDLTGIASKLTCVSQEGSNRSRVGISLFEKNG